MFLAKQDRCTYVGRFLSRAITISSFTWYAKLVENFATKAVLHRWRQTKLHKNIDREGGWIIIGCDSVQFL